MNINGKQGESCLSVSAIYYRAKGNTQDTSLNDCNDLELVVNLSSSNSKQHDINA